ncbi:hypothetical protein FS749_003612, partial [Ceratobasidium sp. UAMH 11750]
ASGAYWLFHQYDPPRGESSDRMELVPARRKTRVRVGGRRSLGRSKVLSPYCDRLGPVYHEQISCRSIGKLPTVRRFEASLSGRALGGWKEISHLPGWLQRYLKKGVPV